MKIWMFYYVDHCGDINHQVVIRANNKTEVGKYIKEHPEKFEDLFGDMKYCDSYKGDVCRALYPNKGPSYPRITAESALFMIPDEKIVDEFCCYDKDCESSAVNYVVFDEGEIISIVN